MKGLVEDMLFLARSDAGREQPVLSDVNLSDITTSALLSFEPVAFENGVALDAEVQPELPEFAKSESAIPSKCRSVRRGRP